MSWETVWETIAAFVSSKWNGWMTLVAALAAAGFIEVTPLPINPWSLIKDIFRRVMSWLGTQFNAPIISDLDEIRTSQSSMKEQLESDISAIRTDQSNIQKTLNEHIETDDARDMDTRRQRILRYNGDLIKDDSKVSLEYFRDMLVEIDLYERYCRTHPEYPNSRAIMAIENIRRVGQEHERKKDWAQ